MKTDGVIFDLDGTLWDATEQICLAWNRVISSRPGLRPPLTAQELESYMGLPMDEISRRMFPDQSPQSQAALLEECCQEEHRALARQGGRLYPELERTLAALSAWAPLFIVSNCEDGYIQCFFQASGLGNYFKDFECFGATGLPKGENNKRIVARNGLRSPVYIGDTAGDQQAAGEAGIPFVFARYGFGQAQGRCVAIDSPAQLLDLLEPLESEGEGC